MGLIVFKLLREERQRSDARVSLLAAAAAPEVSLPLRHGEAAPMPASGDVAARSELFAVAESESPWLRRAGVAAALAAIVALSGYALTRGADSGTAFPPAVAQGAPLELLALSHVLQDGLLTVTGTVQNPRSGDRAAHLVARAFVFDAGGILLASATAGLDYATLAPGDQSQFVISVPVKGSVSRYRVGFRTADGSVVAHVDRRAETESARNGSQESVP
jgi:hypothetical protein